MRNFAKGWKFQLIHCTPCHQQANSVAERTIDAIKQLLKKTIDEKGDVYFALLAYRNTRFYGTFRNLNFKLLRDNVPITEDML